MRALMAVAVLAAGCAGSAQPLGDRDQADPRLEVRQLLPERARRLSGADLANTLTEAALPAARRGSGTISMELVEKALDRARTGVARRRVLSDAERKKIASHETGHAVVARVLNSGMLPHTMSIVTRGHMLGL